MTLQIEALAAVLKEKGFSCSIWQNSRIYLNGYGKDISAFITFDDPTEEDFQNPYSGCCLKVFTKTEAPKSWRVNRCKQVKHKIMLGMGYIVGSEPCERWEDVIL